jgi:hypothetical protein
MDQLDQFIVTLHLMLGHDKTAAYLDQPAGDRAECRLCHPELIGAVTQREAMRKIADWKLRSLTVVELPP